ncbi:hypothetical protein SK128_003027 [Halocaridina rubra]|uniref:Solute carrier family 43 member 3 n=1 Tax=Halocaridina rubra TaxID=373956 RepID=A0AAN9AFS9_HALRR
MKCNQDPNLELSTSRKIIIFFIGTFESMLFGGAVFGWPQLVHVLKVEGLYSDLCGAPVTFNHPPFVPENQTLLSHQAFVPNNHTLQRNFILSTPFNTSRCNSFNRTYEISSSHAVGVEKCDPQDQRFALIYTVTICCYSIPGILVGYLLHHAGLRVTRISGGTMLSLGFLLLGIATKESPHWLFPAMILLALGGNQIRMSVMQFGDLFPAHRATAITLLSGMYAASAALFLIFQFTANMEIDRAHVCWFLAALSSLTVFLSFLMPVHHIPNKEQEAGGSNVSQNTQPLARSLWTASSMLHQLWFFVNLFAVNNYQQTYNVWITSSSCSVNEAGLYSMLFSYSNLITVFISPMGGAFTDYMVKKAGKTPNELDKRVKEVQASFWPLLVTTISTVAMYASILFYHPAAIYVSLIAMIVARPCIIAVSTAYVRIRFPGDHFNRLLGIYGTVTSVLLFLQYPHFMLAQKMYYIAHGLTLAILAISFMNPIHLLFTPLMRHAIAIRDEVSEDDLLALKTQNGEYRSPTRA